jgi:hypothetical protein
MRRVILIRFAHCKYLWPRQESNLNLGLRRPLYYPLYYEAAGALLSKMAEITAKYFYRYRQQYYTEKFSNNHHAIGTHKTFYPL